MDSNLNLPMAQSSLHPPAEIPVATGAVLGDAAADGAWCRVIVGSQFGLTSPTPSPAIGGLLYLHVSFPASGATKITIPAGFRGIAYVLEGEALIGGTKAHLDKRDAAVLSPDACKSDGCKDSELIISNPGEGDIQCLVAAGAPQYSGPLYKTLGNGGAMFAATEDAARACMQRYEKDPNNSGKDKDISGNKKQKASKIWSLRWR
jgi:redox-sensitive bicupin YhaK (pirin superfamily)